MSSRFTDDLSAWENPPDEVEDHTGMPMSYRELLEAAGMRLKACIHPDASLIVHPSGTVWCQACKSTVPTAAATPPPSGGDGWGWLSGVTDEVTEVEGAAMVEWVEVENVDLPRLKARRQLVNGRVRTDRERARRDGEVVAHVVTDESRAVIGNEGQSRIGEGHVVTVGPRRHVYELVIRVDVDAEVADALVDDPETPVFGIDLVLGEALQYAQDACGAALPRDLDPVVTVGPEGGVRQVATYSYDAADAEF